MKTYIIITALALINYSALPPFWALPVTARMLSVYPVYFKIDGVYIYSVTLIRSILDFFPLMDLPATTDSHVNTRSHFGCILFHMMDAVGLQPDEIQNGTDYGNAVNIHPVDLEVNRIDREHASSNRERRVVDQRQGRNDDISFHGKA